MLRALHHQKGRSSAEAGIAMKAISKDYRQIRVICTGSLQISRRTPKLRED